MRYREFTDPFLNNQPKFELAPELKTRVHAAASLWEPRAACQNEVLVQSAELIAEYSDTMLETSYADFKLFLKVQDITGDKYKIITRKAITGCFESYRITVTGSSAVVEAGDTEGIRRGLFYLEDEMNRREGFLPVGTIERTPKIKDRISHGYFSPKSTAETDELSGDTDYYPDEYLNRLAHDGINGLWISVQLRTLVPSEIIPDYKGDMQKIKKLNSLIEKCRRYGIKIYLEGVEPASTYQNPALFNYPEALGATFWGGSGRSLCISTEKGRAYVIECMRNLFTLVPNLGGIINISVGEAVSGCGAVATKDTISCPNCKKAGLTKPQAVLKYEEALLEGIRSVSPNAKYISWAYGERGWDMPMIREYCEGFSGDVIHMSNFEDKGEAVQLGRVRTAIDYWLSYAGPGKVFEETANISKSRNTPLYAKIQTSVSHEIASVPYLPVPGLLYEKFSYMHENNVTGAMLCWYFGNYPCLMNKAAGELSFAPYPQSKDAFLRDLAGIYWGGKKDTVAEAWKLFEEGYKNFPLSVAFEWFGPMTDGVVWPLHLKPVDLPVSSNWLLSDMVGCDRIGECTSLCHTTEEAFELCRLMAEHWKNGLDMIAALPDDGEYKKAEQKSVAEAIYYIFDSGKNIIEFYTLRNKLGLRLGDPAETLENMKEIVLKEIENSTSLCKLCESDPRLGYHNEAEGFKFFSEKLRWRIEKLQCLLETEFKEVSKRIADGLVPLEFYFGLSEGSKRYIVTETDINNAAWDNFVFPDGSKDADTKIRIADSGNEYIIELLTSDPDASITVNAEFSIFHPYIPVHINNLGNVSLDAINEYYIMIDENKEISKWNVSIKKGNDLTFKIKLKKSEFNLTDCPFRLGITKKGNKVSSWEKDDRVFGRLIYSNISPDSLVFIIPKK